MNIKDYKFKTELHAHTKPASKCGQIEAVDVVRNFAELGYNSIVISNHLSPATPYLEDKEKCIDFFLNDFDTAVKEGEKLGVNIILGCEIRFTENHNDYLLFGIDREFISEGYDCLEKGIAEFSKQFRNDKRLLIQAHPFRNDMVEISPEYLDGIEVFNAHPGHNSRISIAAKYAKEHNFISTCGTDYHHPGHEGLVSMLTKTEMKTSHDIAAVLKSRDYLFEMNGFIILPY